MTPSVYNIDYDRKPQHMIDDQLRQDTRIYVNMNSELKEEIIRGVEEIIVFFSAEPKDTSTKYDTTVPSARCSDATISTPAPSNGATGTAAKSLKIKKNTKEVPKKNRRSKKLKNTLKSCKFYYLNIRGLKSKIESLKKIIIEEKPEVIGLVETMLYGKDKVVMEGYIIYRNDRNGDGGVLIAIKDVLKGIMVEESNSKRKNESIRLSLTNNKTKIRIGLVYNPQENKTTKDELEDVYGRIESEIKNARKMEQHIIVMGDMNCKIGDLIDGNKEEISKGGKIMIKMIKEYNMIILNSLEKCRGKWTRSSGRESQ